MRADDWVTEASTRYAERYRDPGLGPTPKRHIAVLACMDARMDLFGMLGLQVGDAHVIRNAGGVVTDADLRSLAVSQRVLATREVVLVHHTGCGMCDFDDAAFLDAIEAETGVRPGWPATGFDDVDENVRACIARVRDCPYLHSTSVRGFVFEVETGRLREVAA